MMLVTFSIIVWTSIMVGGFPKEKESNKAYLIRSTPWVPKKFTKSVVYGNALAGAGFGMGLYGLVESGKELNEGINQLKSLSTLLEKTDAGFRAIEKDLDYIKTTIASEKLRMYYQIERNVITAMNEIRYDTYSSKTLGLELHGDLVFFMEGMLGQHILAADILGIIAQLEKVCGFNLLNFRF